MENIYPEYVTKSAIEGLVKKNLFLMSIHKIGSTKSRILQESPNFYTLMKILN